MGKSIKEIAEYYDTHDTSKEMAEQIKKGNYYTNRPKRITINISEQIYLSALELNGAMQMGYQNVLKTAMLLGLRDLREILAAKPGKKKK